MDKNNWSIEDYRNWRDEQNRIKEQEDKKQKMASERSQVRSKKQDPYQGEIDDLREHLEQSLLSKLKDVSYTETSANRFIFHSKKFKITVKISVA